MDGISATKRMMRLGGASRHTVLGAQKTHSMVGAQVITRMQRPDKKEAGTAGEAVDMQELEIVQVPDIIWDINPLTGDRQGRFPYIYSQRHSKGHVPFDDREFKQMEKKVVCFGCRCRTFGITPETGVTGSIMDTRFHNLMCSDCVADITRVRADIATYRRACGSFMPLPITHHLDRYPWWERYILKGQPDSAIRLVSSFVCPDPDVWHIFQNGEVFDDERDNPKRNCLVAHRYQTILYNHLTRLPQFERKPDKGDADDGLDRTRLPQFEREPDKSDVDGLDPVSVILEYTHPLRMVCVAVGLDCGLEDGTPAKDLYGDGLIWYPDMDVARLEMVPGWSPACHQILRRLPRELIVTLCRTDGHQALNQVYRTALQLPGPMSPPFHDANFNNTHQQ